MGNDTTVAHGATGSMLASALLMYIQHRWGIVLQPDDVMVALTVFSAIFQYLMPKAPVPIALPAPTPANQQGGFASVRLLGVMALGSLLALAIGCSTLSSPKAQLVPTLVTMQVIEKAKDPRDKAARIRKVTDDIESFLTTQDVLTLTSVEQYARAQIDRKTLPPSEIVLWDEVITAVMDDLHKSAPATEILDAATRAVIDQTIDSIRKGIVYEGY